MIVVSSGNATLYPMASRSSSPTLVRRDSILKRAGSVKGDQKKNVSIATDLPSVEMISERRRGTGMIYKLSAIRTLAKCISIF